MGTQINELVHRLTLEGGNAFSNPSLEHKMHDGRIKTLITECLHDIQQQILTKENHVNPTATRFAGNSLITCVAYQNPENTLYHITVVVARDYSSIYVDDFDPALSYDFVQVL